MIQLHLITRSIQQNYQQLPPIEIFKHQGKAKHHTTQHNKPTNDHLGSKKKTRRGKERTE